MTGVIIAAVVFALGAWLAITAIFPAVRPLGDALARLHQPTPTATGGRVGFGWTALTTTITRRTQRVAGLDADLAVTATSPEAFATQIAVATLVGFLAGPLAALLATLATGTVSWAFPTVVLATGGVVGGVVPFWLLRARAGRARRDLRHALGAWLDIVVLLIASGIGHESAMTDAARAGEGPAFRELRRAVTEAGFGANLWDVLDRTGERLAVVELRELAAVAQLASTSGASIRDSLITKARSLRGHLLADQEATAAARGRMMFAPIVLIGFAFITYLVYPLLTNIHLPT